MDEEQAQDCPKMRLTKADKRRIRKSWAKTLILKLLGRNVGFNLKELWRPKSPFELIAIENGYFLVRFMSADDYEYAKYEGPWMIFGHYLTVRPWLQNFDPTQDTLRSILVWVRFPCLPIEYFDYQLETR